MARSKKKNLEEVKMDLTPMIDVTFLLLVFFMLASKFKTQEGQILSYLPKDRGQASSSSEDKTEKRIFVAWCQPRGYNLSKDPKRGRPVMKVGDPNGGFKRLELNGMPNYPALLAYLKGVRARNAKQPVIIDAQPLVPWKYVMLCLDNAVSAGIKDVTFAAREKEIR